MSPCPRCGTLNAPGQPLCARCGAQLIQAPDGLTSTMALGGNVPPTEPDFPVLPERAPGRVAPTWPDVAPLEPSAQPEQPSAPVAPVPPAAPVDAKRTMLGLAPAPVPPPQHAEQVPAYAPVRPKQTMMGIAPPAAPPPPVEPAPAAPAARRAASKTMAGVAPPANAPAALAHPAPAPVPPAALPSRHKTKMGIAHPGIAPLEPAVAKARPRSARREPEPARAAAELLEEDLAVLPGHGRTKSRVPLAIVLIVLAALLLVGAVIGLALWWKSSPGIEAKVALDAEARETLEITCKQPCEFSRVKLGSAQADFSKDRARLALDRALAVGQNEIDLELEEKDGDVRRVELMVPVAYRLKTDFAPLAEQSPRVAVLVEAQPETAVVVDGHAVSLDAKGRGKHEIDVSRELTGAANKVLPLEKKVVYGVTRPKREPERGELVLRIGIVPLSVDAPGESIVIEAANFMLAGRTQTGGSVAVGGRPITVDPSGRFAQLMNVSSVGETTIVVRAGAADHAPRLFPIRVRRVDSLAAEAQRVGARATHAYSAISGDIEGKRGLVVAFEGEIVEARSENHTTIALLDVKTGCSEAPCLARLVYGARSSLERGDTVEAYGHVTRAVDGPRSGAKIPEVRVDFLLAGKRGKK